MAESASSEDPDLNSLSLMLRVARSPGAWLGVLLISAIILLPSAAPFMRWLFPDVPRPVYTRASFFELTIAHVELTGASSLAAAALGISLGIFITRESGREFAPLASALTATAQTLPPVAVLALAIPSLGYGAAPVIVALWLYAIFPIFEGTATGLRAVPPEIREAARGIGFAPADRLFKIELPLALPFIFAGLRSAVTINIGTAAIGSAAGALSLGSPIIEGLAASNPAYILEGALVIALLAITIDRFLAWLEELTRPGRTLFKRACRASGKDH
jgi:osmoprotectant transport system permease protein